MKSFTNWKNLREAEGPVPAMSASSNARAAAAVGGKVNWNRLKSSAEETNEPGNATGSGLAVEEFVRGVIQGNDRASQKKVLATLRKLIKEFPKLIVQEVDAEEAAAKNAGKVR